GPHLDVPEPPVAVERKAERIAVTERPDLRRDAAAIGEWIVIRYRAVVVEAHDLPEVRLHVLCRVELLALARADPQVTVTERDPLAEMPVAGDLRLLPPDHREILERAAAFRVEHEARASDGGAAAAVAGFRVATVDETVLGEVGMQDDVAEAALPAVRDFRHPGDLAHRAVVRRVELEGAALLADEKTAVRQEFHGPRLVELRDGLGVERAVLRENAVVAGTARGEQDGARENLRPPHDRPAPCRSVIDHRSLPVRLETGSDVLSPARPARAGIKLRSISPETAAERAAIEVSNAARSSRSISARRPLKACWKDRSSSSRCSSSSTRSSAQSVMSHAPAPASTAHAAAAGPPGAQTAAPLTAAAPIREAPRAAVLAATARPPRTAAA